MTSGQGGEREAAKPPYGASGTLFGLQGRQLTSLGIVLVVLGLAMFIAGPAIVFSSFPRGLGDFSTFPRTAFLSFFLSILGIISLGIGAWALRFGMIRPVARYLATEAAPGLEYGAEALGRGVAEGLRAEGGGPIGGGVGSSAPAIRVKCRNCGYLETEDAIYCSKCGKSL